MDDVLVVHAQQDVVRDRQIGIVVAVGYGPLDNLVDRELFAVEQQEALLPIDQDGAVRFIGPGGVQDDDVVRLPGHRNGARLRLRPGHLHLALFQEKELANAGNDAGDAHDKLQPEALP